MTQPTYLWTPPPIRSLPVRGTSERYPVDRLFCVGRNYHAHAAEMGKSVDKTKERPFYFTKSPSALVESGATIGYPPGTKNFQHEMELVVAIGAPGFQVPPGEVEKVIYGYACGLDMTRRDLQMSAREQSRPWDLGKDFDEAAVLSEVVPMAGVVLEDNAIEMAVNGQLRQKSSVALLIWNIREIIADLSTFYRLRPGDLIFTGTPEGVSAVLPGDRIEGRVDGVGTIAVTIGEAA